MAGWRDDSSEDGDPSISADGAVRRRINAGDDTGRDATEATRLLGEDSATDTNGVGASNGARKDSWVGFDDFEGLSWWRRPSIYWLLVPYLLFTLAFGGVIVPKLNLILDLVCRHYFAEQKVVDPNFVFAPVILGDDNPQCLIPAVQKRVSLFMLVLSLVAGILSAVTAPRIGRLSDRYGRTRLMAIASCGGVLNEGVMILAAKFPDTVSYNWLILGAVFDGLSGSFTAGSVLTQSYTSDCTPPSRRAVKMGYLHACLFTGLAFGPLLAGVFVKATGSLLSIFYIAMACHAFFIVCVVTIIPDSLSKKRQMLAREKYEQARDAEQRTSSTWLRTLKTSNPLEPLRAIAPRGPGSSPALRRNLVLLAAIEMVIFGSAMGSMTVIMLYSEYSFGWETLETSRFISAISLVRVVVLMGLFPVLNYFARTRPAARQRRLTGAAPLEANHGADRLDTWIIRLAMTADTAGVAGYVFARSGGVFFACGLVTALGGLGGATLQASITKHVPADRVGELLGAVGLLHALARVIAPIVFNTLYAATVDTFPQAVFVLLAALYASSVAAACVIRPNVYLEEPELVGPDGAASRQPLIGSTETLPAEEEEIVNLT